MGLLIAFAFLCRNQSNEVLFKSTRRFQRRIEPEYVGARIGVVLRDLAFWLFWTTFSVLLNGQCTMAKVLSYPDYHTLEVNVYFIFIFF